MLTILAHFVLGFRPILLLQIFSAPYHFSENRLLRKFVLGLKPGFRVWGERFEGELEGSKIKEGEKAAPTAAAAAEGEGEGAGAIPGLGSSSDAATSAVKVSLLCFILVGMGTPLRKGQENIQNHVTSRFLELGGKAMADTKKCLDGGQATWT